MVNKDLCSKKDQLIFCAIKKTSLGKRDGELESTSTKADYSGLTPECSSSVSVCFQISIFLYLKFFRSS